MFIKCTLAKEKQQIKIDLNGMLESLYRFGASGRNQFLQGSHGQRLLDNEYALSQIWRNVLIRNILQEAVTVAESFGGQADPLSGSSAGQAHHIFLQG